MATQSQITFPDDHMLVKLLQAAKSTEQVIIHDAYGFDKTYAHLLADIVKTRDDLRASLPLTFLNEQGLLNDDHPYVGVVTKSAYEFIVAFFAIRSIGGACMPFASGVSLDDAKAFMEHTRSTCILSGRFPTQEAAPIVESMRQNDDTVVSIISISTDAPPRAVLDMRRDESLQINPKSPGLVIFTSGTTGIPKGVVLPKRWLDIPMRIEPGGATVSHRPPYWLGGTASVMAPLLAGIEIYAMKETNDARGMWEIFKTKRITQMGFNPRLLRQLKDMYTDELRKLADDERQQYLNGFRNIEKMSCSGYLMSPKLQQFWTALSGRSFEILYGSTETGLLAMRRDSKKEGSQKHSIGTPWPGVSIKLSEGDHGEILIKHHMILIHYLDNEEATKAVFDEEGYVKTGDLAHLVDGEYIYDGRVADDWVESHGDRISTIQVEDALTDLPYISEAYVVAVPNREAKHICGAVVRLSEGTIRAEEVSLARIRADLSMSLPEYMHPCLLRILKDKEQVQYTVSLKPIKREIVKHFFGVTEFWPTQHPVPDVECWGADPSLA